MKPTARWSSRGSGTQIAALRDGLSNRSDVILSLYLFAAPGDLALARTLRRPWVQWVHAMELPQKPALARSALRRAERSAVLTVSRLAERWRGIAETLAREVAPEQPARQAGTRVSGRTTGQRDWRWSRRRHDVSRSRLACKVLPGFFRGAERVTAPLQKDEAVLFVHSEPQVGPS